MRKKLIFLLLTSLVFCGCGSSAPREAAAMQDSAEENYGYYYGSFDNERTLATGQGTLEAAGESPAAAEDQAAGGTGSLILINRIVNSISDESGRELLTERYDEPVFTSVVPEVDQWVDSLIQDNSRRFYSDSNNLVESAMDYLREEGDSSFYSYSNYQSTGIARHDDRIVSILSLSNVYSGGTGPVSVQTAVNLDLQQMKELTFEDVIIPDKAVQLVRMVAEKVYEKFQRFEGFESARDVARIFYKSFEYGDMTPYWYFNHSGVVVFFNQYELGLETTGIVKVELSYRELEGIIQPEYFPADSVAISGKLSIATDAERKRVIPVVIDPAGARIRIGVEGQVRQVQVSEVFWLEGTPIHKQMLFSASHLEAEDVLEIAGGFTDPNRSFAIEFLNTGGDLEVLYIKNGHLSKEP